MSIFVVDCEADGPVPGPYSMVSFGIVKISNPLGADYFYGQTAPISDKWIPEALKISGHSREEHLNFRDPESMIKECAEWLKKTSNGRAVFLSDNLAFDWQFMNYYFHVYTGNNPFGFSGRRIGDFYSGLTKDWFKSSEWKRLRKTKHSHDPVDDALGNAEALMEICKIHGIKLPS